MQRKGEGCRGGRVRQGEAKAASQYERVLVVIYCEAAGGTLASTL